VPTVELVAVVVLVLELLVGNAVSWMPPAVDVAVVVVIPVVVLGFVS
jgi:hypothetical protein